MKKTVLLGVAVLLLLPCRAQSFSVVLGLKGGVVGCSFLGPDYGSELEDKALTNAWKLGFAAGVFCALDLFGVFSLQPELLVVRTGGAAKEDAYYWGPYDGNVRHVDALTYLSIPVLLKVRLGNAGLYLGADLRVRIGSASLLFKANDETLQQVFEIAGLDRMRYPEDRFAPEVVVALLGVEYVLPSLFLAGEWSVETRAGFVVTNLLGEGQGSFYNALEISLMANYGMRVLGKAYRPAVRHRTRIR